MAKVNGWKLAFAVCLLAAVTAIAGSAQTFTTLTSFDVSNGANPYYMSLVQGMDGNFYGTTERGGTNGEGTFFKVTPSGTLTTLFNFGSLPYPTAPAPEAGVILGDDGNFYGTTYQGGTGYGTVYKITPAGAITVLHEFSLYIDGAFPVSPLVQAADGNFYGTTANGGDTSNCLLGCGTVFKITKEGAFTSLYFFDDDATGHPTAGLVQGPDGALYGTAAGYSGGGAVFRITSKSQFTQLYVFCSNGPPCTDGETPNGGLILGADNNFYGTTEIQGTGNFEPWGTFFKITSKGALTTIYNFCSLPNCIDGGGPFAGVVQATDGNFYGTGIVYTDYSENGMIFQVTPSGTETPLYGFCSQQNCSDGGGPYGGLLQATNGNFYGTTYGYGAFFAGTIYSLSMGLGPFVTFVKNTGRGGLPAGILGQGFKGTTGVSFNGIPASFTVRRDTFLTATVPPGATTGYVTVTTPSGTLTSNVPFHVLP